MSPIKGGVVKCVCVCVCDGKVGLIVTSRPTATDISKPLHSPLCPSSFPLLAEALIEARKVAEAHGTETCF